MSTPPIAPPGALRLLDQVRQRVRYLHYSLRTEEAYVHWIRAFVRFHGKRHPREMGGPQVEAFLSWLSTERGASVSGVALRHGLHPNMVHRWLREQRQVRKPVQQNTPAFVPLPVHAAVADEHVALPATPTAMQP